MEKHRLLIYNIIYNFPVTDYADEENRIKLVVSGTGEYARLLVKTLVWAAQDYAFSIDITAADIALYKALRAACPELFDTERLDDSSDINYCITFSENPPIGKLLCFDCSENKIVMTESNGNKTVFSEDFVFADDIFKSGLIEKSARKIFEPWKAADNVQKADELFKNEFNFNSSCAAALFWLIRRKINKNINVNDENMRLEHRRWNAYMRSEGFRYGAIRDNTIKTHPCLVRYDRLTEEMQSYDANPIRSVFEDY